MFANVVAWSCCTCCSNKINKKNLGQTPPSFAYKTEDVTDSQVNFISLDFCSSHFLYSNFLNRQLTCLLAFFLNAFVGANRHAYSTLHTHPPLCLHACFRYTIFVYMITFTLNSLSLSLCSLLMLGVHCKQTLSYYTYKNTWEKMGII